MQRIKDLIAEIQRVFPDHCELADMFEAEIVALALEGDMDKAIKLLEKTISKQEQLKAKIGLALDDPTPFASIAGILMQKVRAIAVNILMELT